MGDEDYKAFQEWRVLVARERRGGSGVALRRGEDAGCCGGRLVKWAVRASRCDAMRSGARGARDHALKGVASVPGMGLN
jgi:hypothetical protein